MERRVSIRKAEKERGIKRSRSRSKDEEEIKGVELDYTVATHASEDHAKLLILHMGKVRNNQYLSLLVIQVLRRPAVESFSWSCECFGMSH